MSSSEHSGFTSGASERQLAASLPILQMEKIGKRFPGVVALDHVDFEIYPGEIVALIGENGAGKSTLMKILGGVVDPDSGTIRVDGREATIRNVQDASRLGVGFVHQELNVLDNLDVAGNVFLGREPLGWGFLRIIDRGKIYAETDKHLQHLGLNVSSRTPLIRLSLAEQQMVEIAKALSQDARLLILDEPTSSLTLSETNRLFEVMRELKARGVSIIYISHRLAEVVEIADRVVVLRDGRNAGALALEDVSHERMVRMMVGRELSQFYVPPTAPTQQPDYFEVRVLRTQKHPHKAISLSVGKGEILGVAGLVGAGRTEMARAVFGVETALEAKFFLNGAPLAIHSPRDAIAHGVYLIPEDRRNLGLITSQSICENVTLPSLDRYASAGLVNRDLEQQTARKVCTDLNVKMASLETTVGNLSGGNQQKVVLAKWLSLDPEVLIFDEPTRGVDVGAKAEIYALMHGLAESGVAIVVISSDMEEVLGVSDRIAVMHEGMIAGVLERDECNEEAVMRLAVGSA